jgi:dienelactone hydrolase
MSYGKNVDMIAGGLSRILHLRGARENTLADLDGYLDLPAERMFPAPPVPRVKLERSLVDRAIRTTTLRWTSDHEVISPAYRLRHDREYKANHTAWARWVRPEGRRRASCLLYVHGWLEPGSWAEESTLFRKWSRELDVDIVHVSLPFHGKRKPRGSLFSGEFFWTADLVRSIEGVRQALFDARAVMAWLRTQDYEQIGVTGLSLGGAITMLFACVSPTPDYIAPLLAHLKLDEAIEEAPILWRVKHDLDKWGIHEPDRRELFKRLGWSGYPPVLPAEHQLWVLARDDVYINAVHAERQWREWGEPPILWIDGGHMTFPLHIDAITDKMGDFRRRLAAG